MEAAMTENHSRIPVCESDFLQDVSIELGKRLKSVRYQTKTGGLEFNTSTTEIDDREWECFDAIRRLSGHEYVHVVVCENGDANFLRREPFAHKHDTARYQAYVITVAGWTSYEVANLIRGSLLKEDDVLDVWRRLDQRKRG
jgi:predicted metalloprotease with PDZ domain